MEERARAGEGIGSTCVIVLFTLKRVVKSDLKSDEVVRSYGEFKKCWIVGYWRMVKRLQRGDRGENGVGSREKVYRRNAVGRSDGV